MAAVEHAVEKDENELKAGSAHRLLPPDLIVDVNISAAIETLNPIEDGILSSRLLVIRVRQEYVGIDRYRLTPKICERCASHVNVKILRLVVAAERTIGRGQRHDADQHQSDKNPKTVKRHARRFGTVTILPRYVG
ncbi:MAG: hypothetical protein JO135_01280 [Candidatus Eremiobacteraeota bacterium]|nr:hypothetical protein [Candidatus Eremiobacteraeota bacterium]